MSYRKQPFITEQHEYEEDEPPKSIWRGLHVRNKAIVALVILFLGLAGVILGTLARENGSSILGLNTPPTQTPSPTATHIPAPDKPTFILASLIPQDVVAHPGQNFHFIVHVNLRDNTEVPVTSVPCVLSASDNTKTGNPFVTDQPISVNTDKNGNASFSIPIPSGTSPGTYSFKVTATWGAFYYFFIDSVQVE